MTYLTSDWSVIIDQPNFLQYKHNTLTRLLPFNAPKPLYDKIYAPQKPPEVNRAWPACLRILYFTKDNSIS